MSGSAITTAEPQALNLALIGFDETQLAAVLGHGRIVELTHQQLADEVSSVREIVTRILKGFVEDRSVRLGRGSIEVLDAVVLRNVAAGNCKPA
jgi:CRP/FNR family transcriptional regulator